MKTLNPNQEIVLDGVTATPVTEAPTRGQVEVFGNKSALEVEHELDLKALGLNKDNISEILSVKDSFGENTSLSVAEFGKDISKNNKTGDLLKLVHNKDLDVTGDKLNQIIVTAKDINNSNLINSKSGMARLPIIGHLFNSVDKARDKFQMKFNNTEQQINSLINEIELNQKGLKDRVTLLDDMFDSVQDEYRSIGIHIAAGKIKLKEIQEEIKLYVDQATTDSLANQKVYDLNHIYNNLEKRIHDLYMIQESAKQTLPMIRIIQANNLMLIDKAHSIKTLTIPAWKNQIALAISLNEQKNSVELVKSVDKATNDLLRRNADLLHKNSVDTARANQESVISVDTLQYVQNTLIKTVDDVIKIQQDGVKKREEATVKLKEMQDSYNKLIAKDTLRLANK